MGWVIDLDGVVWLADQPVAGSAEAVGRLRARGEEVVFVTNNSSEPVGAVVAKLNAMGVAAAADQVLTSARAAATLVRSGERVMVCAGPGVEAAMRERDARLVEQAPADVVVVGLTRRFDYDRLAAVMAAIRAGARFVATNDDATYPTPDGPIPGGGALVAAVATASGVDPVVAGKPYPPMADLVRQRLGPGGVVVGDRPATDGRLAAVLGYRFALVLTGVTSEADLPVEPAPDLVAPDLAAVVASAGG